MRIATYNIWNSPENWQQRIEATAEEIVALQADVVALQEAPLMADDATTLTDYLGERTGHTFALHLPYPEDETDERPEGLLFLSDLNVHTCEVNWQEDEDVENNWAARIVVESGGALIGVTNVHLDYRDAASRQRQVVRIVRDLIDATPCDYDVLLGDFNEGDEGHIARYLAGRTTLHGHETSWMDAAQAWHSARGGTAPITMDFMENPRWKLQPTGEVPARFDRICVRANGGRRLPDVTSAGLFGKVPSNRHGIVPSDHYGVFVDLDLP